MSNLAKLVFVLIVVERLQDHLSSGLINVTLYLLTGFWFPFERGILRTSKQDRCQNFIELWRKIIQMFISGENWVLKNRLSVLRAQNDTQFSLNIPIVFPRVVTLRHRLTYGGKSDTKITQISKGMFQKLKGYKSTSF